MSLDFQQVREQVRALGEGARERYQELQKRRHDAEGRLKQHARDFDWLTRRARFIASQVDPNLRCALPALDNPEPLDACFSLPELPPQATLIAVDGSQISPDRHAQVNYCLINVGAIQMQIGVGLAPSLSVQSKLIADDGLYTSNGAISEQQLALRRDLDERAHLLELAKGVAGVVITLTDGPMELWGAQDSQDAGEYQKSLEQYQEVLAEMRERRVAAGGYVDKPAASLMVRLLEIATLDEDNLKNVKSHHPFQGVTDRDLFGQMLAPGDRSAVFAIQSRGQLQYRDEVKLHFFYLNVGREGHPWLARVEAPRWVAADHDLLDQVHAVLIQQCRAMGARPYPYILHRAHEAALVTYEEKEQVTQMIVQELYRRIGSVGEMSYKQSAKNNEGRTRFAR
jgi:hypothetical protein